MSYRRREYRRRSPSYDDRRNHRRGSPSRRRSPSYDNDRRRRRRNSRDSTPRRRRFDSPPKESAVIANMYGLTDDPSTYRRVTELNAAAHSSALASRQELDRQAKELYIGNLPPGMGIFALIDRVNDVLVEMGATIMPGKPILSGWLGGEGQFAFVQFRTAEECNNAISMNGYAMDGYQLKIGKPKGSGIQAIGNGPTMIQGRATQFSLDESVGLGIHNSPPLEESTKLERLLLVGAPLTASTQVIERLLSDKGEVESIERIDSEKLGRSSFIFQLKEVSDQRKLASCSLVYDRDYPLAVVRSEEAVSAGFIDWDSAPFVETFKRAPQLPTRIVWLVGFPAIPAEMEPDLVNEVRLECSKVGRVLSIQIFNLSRDCITAPDLVVQLSDMEKVVVVEFESILAATKCRKYISGSIRCNYLNEQRFLDKDFSCFLPNEANESVETPVHDVEFACEVPSIRNGKIISTADAIISSNKDKRNRRVAPEDIDIID
jgi:hypothetical protein